MPQSEKPLKVTPGYSARHAGIPEQRAKWIESLSGLKKAMDDQGFDEWRPNDGVGDAWHRAEFKDLPFPVYFRLGVADAGEVVVTGLLIGDPEGRDAIGTAGLHKITVSAIQKEVAEVGRANPEFWTRLAHFEGEVPKRGTKASGREVYETAAKAYQECVKFQPVAPIQCVADKLGVSRATASRRVQRAKEMDLIKTQMTIEDIETGDGGKNA